VQPRASSELIPGVLEDIGAILDVIEPDDTEPDDIGGMFEDIGGMLEDIGAILDDIGAMLDDIEAIPDDIGPDDIGVMLDDIEDILDMDEVEIICIELSVDGIAIVVMSADMLDPLMSILFLIPIVLIEEASEDI